MHVVQADYPCTGWLFERRGTENRTCSWQTSCTFIYSRTSCL